MEWNMSDPEPDPAGGSGLPMLLLRVAVTLALYLLSADPATVTAWRMRLWHYTGRGARAVAYGAGRLGLEAERRYDIIKG